MQTSGGSSAGSFPVRGRNAWRVMLACMLVCAALCGMGVQGAPASSCPHPLTNSHGHCICPAGQVCSGSECVDAVHKDSGNHIHGFRTTCKDCDCVPAPVHEVVHKQDEARPQYRTPSVAANAKPAAPAPPAAPAAPAAPASSSESAKKDDDVPDYITNTDLIRRMRVTPKTDDNPYYFAPCGKKDVVFLKFHKVGSTTVALALERYANKYNLPLCGRQADFLPSLPCQVWNTHDTETVMAAAGVDGLKFFIRTDPLMMTLLRDPVDRLLSRHFYDIASGNPRASPSALSTAADARKWLEDEPLERFHYLHTLSQGTMSMTLAKANLLRFHLVGVTENFDEYMALASIYLGCGAKEMLYKSEKVVVGRPTKDDIPKDVLQALEEATKLDKELWDMARILMHQTIDKVPGFTAKLNEFKTLQKDVDQRCTFSEMESAVNTGKDCYLYNKKDTDE